MRRGFGGGRTLRDEDGAVLGWCSLSRYREGRAAVRRTAIYLLREFGGSEALPDLTELLTISDDEPFILHPGEFVLGQTLEWVELPDDLVARLEGNPACASQGQLLPRQRNRGTRRPRGTARFRRCPRGARSPDRSGCAPEAARWPRSRRRGRTPPTTGWSGATRCVRRGRWDRCTRLRRPREHRAMPRALWQPGVAAPATHRGRGWRRGREAALPRCCRPPPPSACCHRCRWRGSCAA